MKPAVALRAALFALLAAAVWPAVAQEGRLDLIEGSARAIDADIIIVGDQRVILWGIDAPERSQPCFAHGKIWGCYDASLRTLQTLISRGIVSCVLTGEPDPFKRRHGVCQTGGEDIAAAMVEAGMALAFTEQTDDYVAPQDEAIAAAAGLWQIDVEFEEPWKWRRTRTPGGFR